MLKVYLVRILYTKKKGIKLVVERFLLRSKKKRLIILSSLFYLIEKFRDNQGPISQRPHHIFR